MTLLSLLFLVATLFSTLCEAGEYCPYPALGHRMSIERVKTRYQFKYKVWCCCKVLRWALSRWFRCTKYRTEYKYVTHRTPTPYYYIRVDACCDGWHGPSCDSHELQPKVVFCPGSIEVYATSSSRSVWWTEPIFEEAHNYSMTIDATHENPAVFELGETSVTYTATSSNNNKQATCTFTITVKSPLPKIVGAEHGGDVEAAEGVPVTLQCRADYGKPPYQLSWTIDGSSIPNQRYTVESSSLPGYEHAVNTVSFVATREHYGQRIACTGTRPGEKRTVDVILYVECCIEVKTSMPSKCPKTEEDLTYSPYCLFGKWFISELKRLYQRCHTRMRYSEELNALLTSERSATELPNRLRTTMSIEYQTLDCKSLELAENVVQEKRPELLQDTAKCHGEVGVSVEVTVERSLDYAFNISYLPTNASEVNITLADVYSFAVTSSELYVETSHALENDVQRIRNELYANHYDLTVDGTRHTAREGKTTTYSAVCPGPTKPTDYRHVRNICPPLPSTCAAGTYADSRDSRVCRQCAVAIYADTTKERGCVPCAESLSNGHDTSCKVLGVPNSNLKSGLCGRGTDGIKCARYNLNTFCYSCPPRNHTQQPANSAPEPFECDISSESVWIIVGSLVAAAVGILLIIGVGVLLKYKCCPANKVGTVKEEEFVVRRQAARRPKLITRPFSDLKLEDVNDNLSTRENADGAEDNAKMQEGLQGENINKQ